MTPPLPKKERLSKKISSRLKRISVEILTFWLYYYNEKKNRNWELRTEKL